MIRYGKQMPPNPVMNLNPGMVVNPNMNLNPGMNMVYQLPSNHEMSYHPYIMNTVSPNNANFNNLYNLPSM